MNKKLNKKIFSGVLALSFVFGSGLVSTVSENLGLEYSNVAYAADSIWDIPKDDEFDWIRTSTLDERGYSKVNLAGSGPGTSHKVSLENGKVYYRDSIFDEKKLLPDKGYTWDSLGSYTPLINFLTSHGYEVRQEDIYDNPTSGATLVWDANEVLIWRKKRISDNPANNPIASYGVVKYSGETLDVSELYNGGRNVKSVTFSNGQTSKTLGNVTSSTIKNERLKVTFTDGSTINGGLPVSYTIKPLSDKYKDLSFDETKVPTPTVGDEVSLPDDIIKNLPEGASISKKDPIVTSKAGTVKPKVTVTFSDGSTKDVTVPVVVIELPKTLTKEELDGEYSKYKDKYAEVEFRSHDNKVLKTSYVLKNEAIKASDKVTVPTSTSTERAGYTLTGWSKVELSQQ